jgi:uncharacterized membrane protein SirB2
MAGRAEARAMITFYLQIKLVHIAAVLASGGLFAVRGALVLAGVRWAMAAPLRYLSYTIDTVLLTAALMLLTALKLNPFLVPWLSVKLVLLVVYVVLGSLALKRARSRRARAIYYVAALATFGFMYFVARAHHPLGLLQGLGA